MNKRSRIILAVVLSACCHFANAQTNVSGIISSNTTWDLTGSPYIVTGTILLDSGFILTITPGVTVKFNADRSMQINGVLRALGRPDSIITFTSNTLEPAPGDWDFIRFNDKSLDFNHADSSGSVLSHCLVEYGGGSINGAISLSDAFPFINHCKFRYNANSALSTTYSPFDADHPNKTLEIKHCIFTQNKSYGNGGAMNIFLGQFTSHTLNIDDCEFSHNISSHDTPSQANGGAVFIADALSNSTVSFTRNILFENSATGDGGGLAIFSYSATSSPATLQNATITDNRFYHNHASGDGGALWLQAKGLLKNNLVYHNTATNGAGIKQLGINTTNNLIVGNIATGTYAAYYSPWFGDPLARNQIIDNIAPDLIAQFSNDIGTYNYNTITRNTTTGPGQTSVVKMAGSNNCSIRANADNNNLFNNRATFQFYNDRPQGCDVNFRNSWWGTNSPAGIDSAIHDFQDNSALSVVYYTGHRSSPDTVAPVTPPVSVIKTDLGGGMVKVSWEANPETDIAGYKIYWGNATGYSFAHKQNAGNALMDTISASPDDTIAVTAYDAHADSVKDQFDGHESWFTYATGKPSPDFTVETTHVCSGDSVAFTNLTPEAGPYSNSTWMWSFPGGTPSESAARNPKVIYEHAGVYNVLLKVTNIAGTDSVLKADFIVVDTLPDLDITANGPLTFCEGDSVVLDAGPGHDTYQWSTTETSRTITVHQGGAYSVAVTNFCGTSNDEVTVTVHSAPAAGITPDGPTTFCEGGSVNLTASEGSSYEWSTGETAREITVTASGEYSVQVTSNQGCSAMSDVTPVTVNPKPSAAVTPSGIQTICTGDSLMLTSGAAVSYQWNNGQNTQSIYVSFAGKYAVTVTDDNGCIATSDSTAIVLRELPEAMITPGGSTTFCEGDSVLLTASESTSYLWSTAETARHITVKTTGEYTVTVEDDFGCSATSTVTTTVANPVPEATISPDGPTTFCDGGSVSLAAVESFSYLWSTSQTTRAILATASGDYSVTVTNSYGCSATSGPQTVTVKPRPDMTVEDQMRCGEGTLTFTASGEGNKSWFTQATGGVAVATGNSFTTPSLSANTTYYVESDLNGCVSQQRESVQATVTIVPKPVITANNTNPAQPQLSSSANSGNQWFLDDAAIPDATSQTLAVAEEGIYTVQVTTNGCVSVMSDPYEYVLTGIEGGRARGVTVYPNPATNELTVTVSRHGKFSVTVTDLLGRAILEASGNGPLLQLDLSVLNPGRYLILIRRGNVVTAQMFIKK